MTQRIQHVRRPKGYSPPKWKQVESLLVELRRQRQPKIDKIRSLKKARRDDWSDVLNKLPAAYRNIVPPQGFPDLEDMVLRIVGMIAAQRPMIQVIPPAGRAEDVRKASKEEARIGALYNQIIDQQDRDIYALGIDAQCAWGESWIAVLPDPRRYDPDDEDEEEDDKKAAVAEAERQLGYRRGKDEGAKEYIDRHKRLMANGGVPICMTDFDPQTVYPFRSADGDTYRVVLVETEHTMLDINLGYGYKPVRNSDGKTVEWLKNGAMLSEPYVGEDAGVDATNIVDLEHDSGRNTSDRPTGNKVKRVLYFDCWTYQCWLDGVLVEEWCHNWGFVSIFPALGQQTSDRDPAWQSRSVIDGAYAIAKQIVLWSAMLSASALQHSFPTPFLKNPEGGVIVGSNGAPLTRTVRFGELNVLGLDEDIVFPYLDAKMGDDFYRNMDMLMSRMSDLTMQGFGQNISPETSGYAVAQVRAMYQSMVSTVYLNAKRQVTKIAYALRHVVRTEFPAGLFLRGAVETAEVDGQEIQYRPILEYGKEHCTDFAIETHIDEGVVQDELAERKSAIEMVQSQLWSPRRGMEHSGVEDPASEIEEISQYRLLNSPAADQLVMTMAAAMAAERYTMSRTDQSSPFGQYLEQAMAKMMGGGETAAGPGQFANQGNEPANALPGGQPMQQNAPPAPSLQRAPSQAAFGVPQIPGGVAGNEPQGLPV